MKQSPKNPFAVGSALSIGIRKVELREWVLWATAILVTLLLTLGILSFALPSLPLNIVRVDHTELNTAMRGLVGLVLLFDLYTIYQQLQIARIRRQLVQSEELFRLISENAADMIVLVDAEGHYLYHSPSYEKVLGYTTQELQSAPPLSHVHPEDHAKIREASQQAFRGEGGRRIEYRARHKDGTWRLLESTANTVPNAEGRVEKLVVVTRNITERKRLEEQFRQAQKMEAVGRLSGGIAHDFNNLLGVIIGYGEILREKLLESDPLRTSADEILRAGHRAADLTRQLLAFSRQQVLEPRVLDLNSVVSDLERMLRRLIGEDIELTGALDPSLGTVRADQGQIEQAIVNLVVNARDAMPNGGKLIVETANIEMDDVFVRRYPYPVQPGRYVRITVSDTGTGMDSATQARIFEPFFTTKPKGHGTGLGLSMVYGVVKQSGGYIDVYSEPGIGTTFKIYLPRVDEVVTSEPSQPAQHVPRLEGHETILLVEDEAGLRTLARNLLQLGGYTVLEAADGYAAMEIARNYQGVIHLLLTDVVMPGIGGRALAQQLLAGRPQLQVVYMSGYTGQTVGARDVLEPGSIFLQKPFTRASLTERVREALDSGRADSKRSVAAASGDT